MPQSANAPGMGTDTETSAVDRYRSFRSYVVQVVRSRRASALRIGSLDQRLRPTMTANGDRRHGTSTVKPARSSIAISSASGTYTSSSAHDS